MWYARILSCSILFSCQAVLACPDPMTESIHIKALSRHADGSLELKLIARVKNSGSVDFISNKDQQTIKLSIQRYSARGEVESLLSYEAFPSANGKALLKAQELFSIEYYGTLNAIKDENAAPRLRLKIDYTGDIYQDNNAQNDDCRSDNNELTKILQLNSRS